MAGALAAVPTAQAGAAVRPPPKCSASNLTTCAASLLLYADCLIAESVLTQSPGNCRPR
jgi:hypothetical protein